MQSVAWSDEVTNVNIPAAAQQNAVTHRSGRERVVAIEIVRPSWMQGKLAVNSKSSLEE